MSQEVYSSIDPATTSGTELAVILNDFKNAIMSGLSGTSRPVELQQGGMWIDTATSDKLILKVFTGTTDISLFSIGITEGILNIDALKIGDGSVTNTEYSYLAGVSSAIQSQLDTKVIGDSSSSINAIATFYNTTGKRIQNGVATLTPAGAIGGLTSLSLNGPLITSSISLDSSTTGTSALIPSTTSNKLFLVNSSLVSVGGMESSVQGRRIIIQNNTGNIVIVKNEDSSISSVKRIVTGIGGDLSLANQASIELIYDTTFNMWSIIGGSGAGGTTNSILVNPSFTPSITLNYTDSGNKYIINSQAGAFTLYLPQPNSSKISFTIKDSGGKSDINPITIARYSSENIEGVASNFIADAPYGHWTISCDGTNWHFTS